MAVSDNSTNITVDSSSNYTLNFTEEELDEMRQRDRLYTRMIIELFSLIGLIDAVAIGLLVFAVVRYKKLRQDITNIILVHHSIIYGVYLILMPFSLRLIVDFEVYEILNIHFACVVEHGETSLLFAMLMFHYLLLIDWYLKTWSPIRYNKFKNVYRFFIVLIYILFIFWLSVAMTLCMKHRYHSYTELVVAINVLLLIFLTVILNIVNRILIWRRKRNIIPNVGLAFSNIFISCWIPFVIILFIAITVRLKAPIVIILFAAIGFTSPIFNVVYLYLRDKDFKVFLERIVSLKCNEYENENLNENEEEPNYERPVAFSAQEANEEIHI